MNRVGCAVASCRSWARGLPLGLDHTRPARHATVVPQLTNTVDEFSRWAATIVQERYMIDYDLDTAQSIVLVRPQSALERDDFVKLANAVDPQIEATGELAGVIIDARHSQDGRAWGQWSPTSALFEIITSR
jgi:hypothetical protein